MIEDVDRIIHEPARLIVMGILTAGGQADFTFLLNETGLTRGNLSSHLMKLEEAGYIAIEKTFRGKQPLTLAKATPAGRAALTRYRKTMLALLSTSSPSLPVATR